MTDPQTNLRVRISADIADIKSGLAALRADLVKTKAAAASNLTTKAEEAQLRRFASATRLAVVGISAAVVGAGAAIKGALDRADQMSKTAQKVGIGTAALSQLVYAAELADVNIDQLTGSLGIFNKKLQDNEKTLKKFGISIRDSVTGELKPSQEIIREIADLFASAPDGPKKAALAMKLFGKSGAELIPLLNGGGNEMKRLADESDRLGRTIDEKTGKAAEQFNDDLTRLKSVAVGFAGALTKELLPGLQSYVTGLLEGAKSGDGFESGVKRLADVLRTVGSVIVSLLENLDTLAVFLGTRLALGAIATAVAGFGRLVKIIAEVREGVIGLRLVMLTLGGPVGIVIAALAAAMYYLYQRTTQAKVAAEEHTKALAENTALSRTNAQAALAEAQAKRQQALQTLNAAKAILEERRARLAADFKGQSAVGAAKDSTGFRLGNEAAGVKSAKAAVEQSQTQLDDWTRQLIGLQLEIQHTEITAATGVTTATDLALGGTEKLKKAVHGVIDTADLSIDAIKRQMDALDHLFEKGKIGIADFYAKKQQLELASIDAQIAQAEAEAKTATTSEQQSKALTDIIKLQRERAEVGVKAAQAQADAEEDLTRKLGQVQIRLLEASGQVGRARMAELQEEFRDLITRLEAEGDTAGLALVRKLINVEAIKGQLQQFQSEAEKTLGNLHAYEASLSAQSSAGMLGVFAAEQQIAEQRSTALEQLRQLRERVLAYYKSTKDPDVLLFLQQLNGNIADVSASQHKLAMQAADAGINSLTQFFTDLASGTKTAKEALRDFVLGFVGAMAQIAARALATYLVLKLLDAIYPGLGAATAAGMSAGVKHGGGIAGEGGTIRSNLSPLLFGLAPRYHGGGIAGLAPDEVPAVLEKGEEVLTKNNPRHRNNVGQGVDNRPVRNIVVFSEEELANAMAGAAGEKVVVTHARSNRMAINSD